MDRNEIKNAIELYRIRNRVARRSHFILYAIPIFLFFIDLLGVFTKISFYSNQVDYFNLNTYSNMSFFSVMVFSLALALDYNTFNQQHEVLPQTNKTRLFSYGLYNYVLFIKVSVVTLVVYLVQYGMLSILGNFKENVHLAYDFSLYFITWGFVVNLIYGFLAIGLLIFLVTLDRKYGLIFKIIAGIFSILLIVSFTGSFAFNGEALGAYIMKAVGFLTKEPSLILFTIKGTILWGLLSWISWVINLKTVYFKTKNFPLKNSLALSTGLFFIITIYAIFTFMNFSTVTTSNTEVIVSEEVSVSENVDISDYAFIQIPVDCSTLKEGDIIKIITDFSPDSENISIWTDTVESYSLKASDIDKLHVSYRLGEYLVDNVNLDKFSKPTFEAVLEGTNLHINYSYEKNQKVFILSPYSFMNQFECFKDKNLYNSVFGTYMSSGHKSIRIIADDGIKVTPIY